MKRNQVNNSVYGLKPECLSYREVLAQSFAVIAPTTTPAANLGSLYTYIVRGLSPTAGVLCGWSLVLAYLVTGMATLVWDI